jgi:hypothetical protein
VTVTPCLHWLLCNFHRVNHELVCGTFSAHFTPCWFTCSLCGNEVCAVYVTYCCPSGFVHGLWHDCLSHIWSHPKPVQKRTKQPKSLTIPLQIAKSFWITVEPVYNDIDLYETSTKASAALW